MLTEAQISTYHEKGFVTPDYRIPADTVADIADLHDRLLKKHPDFYNYCPSLLAYDLGFLNFARIPAVLDMVAQVIGPDFALWNSSFFAKPANGGHETRWHQDGEYWPIQPLATCTVWIAVDAATQENGCLEVIPGSHTTQRLRKHNTNPSDKVTLNQELDPSEFNRDQAEYIELEPGQVSLHDVYLVHGSQANNSNAPRRGMTLRFMPTTSVYDRELAKQKAEEYGLVNHSDRTLFLMRGVDKSGNNDFSMKM